jgi:hypothetical protein
VMKVEDSSEEYEYGSQEKDEKTVELTKVTETRCASRNELISEDGEETTGNLDFHIPEPVSRCILLT